VTDNRSPKSVGVIGPPFKGVALRSRVAGERGFQIMGGCNRRVNGRACQNVGSLAISSTCQVDKKKAGSTVFGADDFKNRRQCKLIFHTGTVKRHTKGNGATRHHNRKCRAGKERGVIRSCGSGRGHQIFFPGPQLSLGELKKLVGQALKAARDRFALGLGRKKY